MNLESNSVLLTIVTSAASALAAGWLGVKAGVAQFRREKAFDRRLEWYEAAIKAMRSYAIALGHVIQQEENTTTSEDRVHAWQELDEQVGRFFDIVPHSQMYATRATHRALGVVAVRGQNLSQTIIARQTPHPDAEQLEALASLRRLMLQTSSNLTHELRQHLGLDDLNGPPLRRLGPRIRGVLTGRSQKTEAEP